MRSPEPVLLGEQKPRTCSAPLGVSSAGQEAIDLAARAGLLLDPWQRLVLDTAMREDRYGKWAAFEVGLVVARQNGKGAIITARELYGLFVLDEYIVHTAHVFETSLEAFTRLLDLIEATPDLDRRVAKKIFSHGEEGIKLKTGGRIKFKTRTKSGGRGLSGDLVILDEAMILTERAVGSLIPMMTAKPNPQVWYAGSAVDTDVHDAGYVFGGIRDRGLKGDDPSLAYFEWSADPGAEPTDMAQVAKANPSFGIRISPEYVQDEWRTLQNQGRTYHVERLSIGNWPKPQEQVKPAIDPARWSVMVDRAPQLTGAICLALDMTPDLKWVTIGAAALKVDGGVHVEVGYHQAPVARAVVAMVLSLVGRWDPCAVVMDRQSPVMSLMPDLRAAGIEPETTSAAQLGQAGLGLYHAVADSQVSHTGDPLIQTAVAGAAKRDLSGGLAFTRIGSAVISPVVTISLARWGLLMFDVGINPPPPPEHDRLTGAESAAEVADLMRAGF